MISASIRRRCRMGSSPSTTWSLVPRRPFRLGDPAICRHTPPVRWLIRILAAGVAAIGIGVPQASAEVRVHLAKHGAFRSATVAVPPGATVAGVHAHGALPRTVQVRAAGGWVSLDDVGGGFTEPVWIGRARHVALRVRGGGGGRISVVF